MTARCWTLNMHILAFLLFRTYKFVHASPDAGAEDDEWDDEWDDAKSTGGYAESEAGEGGAMQRGGATSMKISLNK